MAAGFVFCSAAATGCRLSLPAASAYRLSLLVVHEEAVLRVAELLVVAALELDELVVGAALGDVTCPG